MKLVKDCSKTFKKLLNYVYCSKLVYLSSIFIILLSTLIETIFFLPFIIISWLIVMLHKKHEIQDYFRIRKKLQQFYAIINSVGVGIISTDEHGKITFMNTAAEEICGWYSRFALGRSISDIIKTKLEKSEDKTLNSEVMVADRGKFTVRKDGRRVSVQKLVFPLNVHGKAAGNIVLIQDITAVHALINKLSYNASHDGLTGITNRANFEAQLAVAVENSEESQHTLVFLDLDDFKSVNDIAGHAAGDALLKEIAQLLRYQLRKTDVVARLGGDEFGIILYNCSLSEANILSHHLVRQIIEYIFYWEGVTLRIGASAGLTCVVKRLGVDDVTTLLHQADTALYNAKRLGKGCVCVYDESQKLISNNTPFKRCLVKIEELKTIDNRVVEFGYIFDDTYKLRRRKFLL